MKRGTLFKEFLYFLSLIKSFAFPEAERPHGVKFSIFPMASLPNWELVLERALVGNGQFLSALSTPCGQHPSAIGGRHALPEPVLVPSLSPGRLVCSFHDSDDLASFMRAAKIITNSKSPKSPEGDAPFGRIPSGQGIASVPVSGYLITNFSSGTGALSSTEVDFTVRVCGPAFWTTVSGNLTPAFST